MSNFSTSTVRTVTPIVVGYVVALLIKAGVHTTSASVTLVLAPVISAAYYLLVHGLEQKYPKLGRLLGIPATPQYDLKGTIAGAVKQVAPAVEAAAAKEVTKLAKPTKTGTAAKTTAKKATTPKK